VQEEETVHAKLLPPERNEIRNKQMFFGGIPLHQERPTLIKQVEAPIDFENAKKKKFSTEAFLDLYFEEKNRKFSTF
jgi:hypothetical protein